jgi:hypothetical protein
MMVICPNNSDEKLAHSAAWPCGSEQQERLEGR